jgi:hypothetical protein
MNDEKSMVDVAPKPDSQQHCLEQLGALTGGQEARMAPDLHAFANDVCRDRVRQRPTGSTPESARPELQRHSAHDCAVRAQA